jgi:hypothetical protein
VIRGALPLLMAGPRAKRNTLAQCYNLLVMKSYMNRAMLPMVLGAMILVVLAGCGGGNDEDQAATATAAPPITKAVFIKKASKVCEGLGARLLAISEQQEEEGITPPTGKEAEIVAIRTRLVPGLERELAELQELGAPKGDEKRVNAIYESMEEVIQSAKSDPLRFNSEVGNFERPYGKVERLATAYGIPVCSQP